MIKKLLAISLLCFSYSISHADTEGFETPDVDVRHTHWDFGIFGGIAIPIGNKSTSIIANNSAFLVSDPSFPGEDEFAENGLPSPDFTAQSRIEGNVQNAGIVGGHLYYAFTSWLAAGLEGSVSINRAETITAAGDFNVPIYANEFDSHGGQIAPSIRLGGWYGKIHPYIMAGAGPYFLYQRMTAELVDPDDPDHPPVIAGETNNTYLSALYGGGIDVSFTEQGSIGLAIQYQRIFMPGNNLQYFVPTLRFNYLF